MRLALLLLLLVAAAGVAGSSAGAERPARADLAVALTTADPAVGVGRRATFRVGVTNRGPGRAVGVVLVVRVTGADEASASDRRCTLAGTTVSCRLRALAGRGRVAVSVEARSRTPGALAASATVSARTRDPRPRNNRALRSTSVLGLDSVHGHGVRPTYRPGGGSPLRVSVDIDAISDFDGGEPAGTFATRYPNGDPELSGHVVCLAVVGNRAMIGGIIDSASGSNVGTTPPGSGVLLAVTDNGEPGVDRDTQISYIGTPADDARSCALGDPSVELALTDGNFTVHDEHP